MVFPRWPTACLAEIGQAPSSDERESADGSKYKQMFRLRALHLLAFFVLIYIGVEVTLGGAFMCTISSVFLC